MATQTPQSLQDIQDAIHVITSSDPNTPLPADDQWKTRLQLINRAIARWERQDVYWRELFATYTPDTIVAGQQSYSIGAPDFQSPASLVRVYMPNSTTPDYLDVIPASDMQKYPGGNTGVCYFTGNNKEGFTLNLGWMPTASTQYTGATFNFDYNKSANRLSSPTDKPQMNDPDYIVFWASSQELLFNGRTTLAELYLSDSDALMQGMKVTNEMVPIYGSLKIPDNDFVRDSDIWGE